MREKDSKLSINMSFPQYDKHIYDYIKAKPNPSAFIRKLVEAYINQNFNEFQIWDKNIQGYATEVEKK